MTELVTSGSVGGMASNGCLYPEVATRLLCKGNNLPCNPVHPDTKTMRILRGTVRRPAI